MIRFKIFAFSRLKGEYRIRNGEIGFSGPVKLWVSSPNKDILESFATHLVKESVIRLGRNTCELISVEVRMSRLLKLLRTFALRFWSTIQRNSPTRHGCYL